MPSAPRSAVAAVTGPSFAGVPEAADVRVHVDRAWRDGYRTGWDAGADVGAGRVMIGLRAGWPDLTALSPTYRQWRAQVEAGPCDDRRCGACTVRRDALSRYVGDFPGVGQRRDGAR